MVLFQNVVSIHYFSLFNLPLLKKTWLSGWRPTGTLYCYWHLLITELQICCRRGWFIELTEWATAFDLHYLGLDMMLPNIMYSCYSDDQPRTTVNIQSLFLVHLLSVSVRAKMQPMPKSPCSTIFFFCSVSVTGHVYYGL